MEAVIKTPNPEQWERLLEGLIAENIEQLKSGRFPSLYDSGVVYRPERGTENWLTVEQIHTAGAADCEDLSAARVAELRLTGKDPDATVYIYQSGPARWHATVQRGSGDIEDPTKILQKKEREEKAMIGEGYIDPAEFGTAWWEQEDEGYTDDWYDPDYMDEYDWQEPGWDWGGYQEPYEPGYGYGFEGQGYYQPGFEYGQIPTDYQHQQYYQQQQQAQEAQAQRQHELQMRQLELQQQQQEAERREAEERRIFEEEQAAMEAERQQIARRQQRARQRRKRRQRKQQARREQERKRRKKRRRKKKKKWWQVRVRGLGEFDDGEYVNAGYYGDEDEDEDEEVMGLRFPGWRKATHFRRLPRGYRARTMSGPPEPGVNGCWEIRGRPLDEMLGADVEGKTKLKIEETPYGYAAYLCFNASDQAIAVKGLGAEKDEAVDEAATIAKKLTEILATGTTTGASIAIIKALATAMQDPEMREHLKHTGRRIAKGWKKFRRMFSLSGYAGYGYASAEDIPDLPYQWAEVLPGVSMPTDPKKVESVLKLIEVL